MSFAWPLAKVIKLSLSSIASLGIRLAALALVAAAAIKKGDKISVFLNAIIAKRG